MKKIKNILITGGAGRIGKVITDALLYENHKIIIGDITFKNINFRNDQFKNNLFKFKSDLTKEKNIQNFIKFGVKKFGSIDVLIHCAYPKTKDWGKTLDKINQKNLNKNITDNLGSSIILSKYIIRQFLKQKEGNLIFLSSIYGLATPKFEDYNKTDVFSPVEYGAIKSGIISTIKFLAKYYKNKNLRINCISPGGIKDNQPHSFVKNYAKNCNSKGLLNADDLSGLIKFLISEESKYINGQNIVVDDGWSL